MVNGDSVPARDNRPFALLVRRARHAAWMTQEELAGKSGLSPRTIQAIERGEVSRPHRESVRLLADALGLRDTARTAFERAARQGCTTPADTHACPPQADCLLRRVHGSDEPVDLTGLGHTAPVTVVLARLLTALGVDPRDYGFAGAPLSDHTLPVQMLPGA